jgi:hypothetical protein
MTRPFPTPHQARQPHRPAGLFSHLQFSSDAPGGIDNTSTPGGGETPSLSVHLEIQTSRSPSMTANRSPETFCVLWGVQVYPSPVPQYWQ